MTIKTIYLSGAMDDPQNGWRSKIVEGNLEISVDDILKTLFGDEPTTGPTKLKPLPKSIFNQFDYGGPFFVKGLSKPKDEVYSEYKGRNYSYEDFYGYFQFANNISLNYSDFVYFWLDDKVGLDVAIELTHADVFRKTFTVCSNEVYPQLLPLYFTGGSSRICLPGETPESVFKKVLELRLQRDEFNDIQQRLSPIEVSFFEEWVSQNENLIPSQPQPIHLIPQYEVIGRKYRVDFAHLETKTAIELDGLEAHKTTDQIASDRKRQREIEQEGWRFIRFGGKEVFNDVRACVIETRNFILKTAGQ